MITSHIQEQIAIAEFGNRGFVGLDLRDRADLPCRASVIAVDQVRMPRVIVSYIVIARDPGASGAQLNSVCGSGGVPSPIGALPLGGDVRRRWPRSPIVRGAGYPNRAVDGRTG